MKEGGLVSSNLACLPSLEVGPFIEASFQIFYILSLDFVSLVHFLLCFRFIIISKCLFKHRLHHRILEKCSQTAQLLLVRFSFNLLFNYPSLKLLVKVLPMEFNSETYFTGPFSFLISNFSSHYFRLASVYV